MTLDITKLDKAIKNNLYNPQNIFRDSMELFSSASSGEMVAVSAVTPFANMMLYMATQSAINNDQVERAARRMLPEYANSISELAPHFDYNTLQTIYATPSSTVVNLVLPVEEMVRCATVNADGTKQMIVPSDTIFTYTDGIKFTLHHSIMIRMANRDAIDVYYINEDNPLNKIESPIINYSKSYRKDDNFNSTEFIIIPIKVYQFSTRTEYRSVSASSGFKEVFTLKDQLYHIRATTMVGGKVVELLSAHGDFKYNPNSKTPIMVIQYLADNNIRLKIPDVFIEQGLIGSDITIRILETKGNLSVDMVNDGTFNFVPEFINNDASIEKDVNALRKILNLGAYSASDPAGGVDMPTLAELRNRVIVGQTSNEALAESQLSGKLAELGYTLNHELNYIGTNVYTTTHKLSDYSGGIVPTSIGGSNVSMVLNDLIGKVGIVFPVKDKVVITPSALIVGTKGTPIFMGVDEHTALNALDTNATTSKLNSESIMVPIFYYLLDKTEATPKYGVFDLDNPSIHKPAYMASNVNNVIKMATKSIHINKDKGSYFIHILTEGNDTARELSDGDITIQLTTADKFGSIFSINAALKGRDKEGNFLFRAELRTGFNVGMGGTIEILNFSNDIYDSHNMDLSSKFNINYIVTSAKYVTDDNSLEKVINPTTLPGTYSVITREETVVTIGTMLSGIFSPIKSSPAGVSYQRHTSDVLKFWEEDVYEMDSDGLRKFFPNPNWDDSKPTSDTNPSLLFNKLHSKGDPVMNPQTNKQEISAHKGHLVLDSSNNPIPLDTKSFNHLVNIQAMDYKFTLIDYLPKVQSEIVGNITRDVLPISGTMIPDTELKYTLSNTLGNMEIIIDGSTRTTISNEITMRISIKVSDTTYKDSTLRANIKALVKKEVAKHLSKGYYTENVLVDAIHGVISSSVISFKIESISTLGGAQSFQLVNPSDNMGIKSILAISDTGAYEILDGIEVGFVSL